MTLEEVVKSRKVWVKYVGGKGCKWAKEWAILVVQWVAERVLE